LGWTIGRNVRIETRWATPDAAEVRKHAAEMALLSPDVILAHGAATLEPLLQACASSGHDCDPGRDGWRPAGSSMGVLGLGRVRQGSETTQLPGSWRRHLLANVAIAAWLSGRPPHGPNRRLGTPPARWDGV
jgi:hypothetical protein